MHGGMIEHLAGGVDIRLRHPHLHTANSVGINPLRFYQVIIRKFRVDAGRAQRRTRQMCVDW